VEERKVVVKKGDTLARIARRHQVKLAELCEWNDLAADAKPRRGTVLVLPVRGAPRRQAAPPVAPLTSAESARGHVRAIPTPSAAIASATQLGNVALATPSAAPSTLPQRYEIPAEGFVSEPAPRKVVYTVRRGDTLFHIAQEHGLTVDAIRKLNRLGSRDVLAAGRRLTLVLATAR
jgi:membrane-bound lytic murein transglycosylase D